LLTRLPQVDNLVAEDYGLPRTTETATHHLVTPKTCSCQFPSCWGLPCRHMLALYFNQSWDAVVEGVISTRWLTISQDEAINKFRALLNNLIGEDHGASSSFTRSQTMTQHERYAYCLAESKVVIDIAALTTSGMEAYLDCLDACKRRLRDLTTTQQLQGQYGEGAPPLLNPPTSHSRPCRLQSKRRKSMWES
jgi:hypothetical protein